MARLLPNVKMQIQLTPPMSANKPANSPADPEIKLKESKGIPTAKLAPRPAGFRLSVELSMSEGSG